MHKLPTSMYWTPRFCGILYWKWLVWENVVFHVNQVLLLGGLSFREIVTNTWALHTQNVQKPKDSELLCTESLCWLDKESLLRSTEKVNLKQLCGCLTWNLKNAPFTFIHRGNTIPQPLTFLKLKSGRALLLAIQVRHCLVFALAILLSVRGMTDFSEHQDNTRYPDDVH